MWAAGAVAALRSFFVLFSLFGGKPPTATDHDLRLVRYEFVNVIHDVFAMKATEHVLIAKLARHPKLSPSVRRESKPLHGRDVFVDGLDRIQYLGNRIAWHTQKHTFDGISFASEDCATHHRQRAREVFSFIGVRPSPGLKSNAHITEKIQCWGVTSVGEIEADKERWWVLHIFDDSAKFIQERASLVAPQLALLVKGPHEGSETSRADHEPKDREHQDTERPFRHFLLSPQVILAALLSLCGLCLFTQTLLAIRAGFAEAVELRLFVSLSLVGAGGAVALAYMLLPVA